AGAADGLSEALRYLSMPAIISSVGHRAGCRLMKAPIGRRRRRLGGATRENVREYIDGHATAPPFLCGSPRSGRAGGGGPRRVAALPYNRPGTRHALAQRHRSEEHTSELQSRENLVCRLLLEKKKKL